MRADSTKSRMIWSGNTFYIANIFSIKSRSLEKRLLETVNFYNLHSFYMVSSKVFYIARICIYFYNQSEFPGFIQFTHSLRSIKNEYPYCSYIFSLYRTRYLCGSIIRIFKHNEHIPILFLHFRISPFILSNNITNFYPIIVYLSNS